jgi:hypothetical protein
VVTKFPTAGKCHPGEGTAATVKPYIVFVTTTEGVASCSSAGT